MMDTSEWVLLSDDGFFDINEDSGDENHIFLGKRNSESKDFIDMEYFGTSPKSAKTSEIFHPEVTKEVVHVPIEFEPRIEEVPDEGLVEENAKDHHVGVTIVPSSPTTTEKTKGDGDQDPLLFKELESPKLGGRGLFPPLDISGDLKFEDKGEAHEIMASPRMRIEKEMVIMECDKQVEDTSSGGFNFWKWSLSGVGAICSFGFAAATICVLFFGSHQRNKLQEGQKIRFQIYTDDKRIKHVVQEATKLNEAISVVSGVPLNRARITCGGYYDGV